MSTTTEQRSSNGAGLRETLRGALDVLGDAGAGARPEQGPARGMRKRARDYGLAVFALADSLARELKPSPRKRGLLDLMRVDSFLVASKCHRLADSLAADSTLVTAGRDDAVATLLLVARLIADLDRRIADHTVPLRATAYLRTRDRLLEVLDP